MSNNSNTKQAAWVAIGSFFSFLVGIISPMILSRVFSKGDYGTYKQVMYVYSTFLLIFTLGLPKAYSYFIPKYSRDYAKDVINKITNLFIGMGFVFSAVLFTGSGFIASILKNPDLELALKYFSPTPLFLLPTIGLDGIYAAFRKTQYLTVYTIITRFLTVLLTVAPVFWMNGNYIHAIIGFDIASLLTCLIALMMKSSPVRKETHKKSSLTYKEILQFSLPLMVASFWGIILSSANQFFVSRYYGNEDFAEFSNGFMEIPFATMVIGAIATVLLPRFSEMEEGEKMNDEVYATWQSALIKSAKIIFPILIFSVVFARLIMVCMYGDAYGSSSVYFMIKNISSLLYIIPFAPIMLAIGKTKDYARAHMVAALLIIILEYLCVKTFESPITIAISSEICQAIKIYLMMKVIAHYAGRSIIELVPIKPLSKILVTCLLAALITYTLSLLFSINKFVLAALCALLFCSIYYGLCWVVRLSYKEIVIGLLPQTSKPFIKFLP